MGHSLVQKLSATPPPLAPARTGMTTASSNIAMTELVTPCQRLVRQRVISLRNREAPLPPPPHAAAQLIKTQTFNKTPHYHNGKT